MLKEVSSNEWVNYIKTSDNYSIFIDPSFIKPICEALGYSSKYYINFIKSEPIVGFACFVRGKKIKVPTHFIYSGVWYNTSLNTIKFRDALLSSIRELKKEYSVIELRLPPVFNDIRPFQWEGFTYLVNYTYVKTLSDLNFEYNIRSREKKALESGISLSLSSSFVRIWQHQQMDLKRFNFPDLTLRKLQKMFNDWHKSGFLQIYEAVYKEAIIGSSCILIDKTSSTAYNLLISSENKNYRTGVHAALYSFICRQSAHNNIADFDLYGADIKGVADFKSSLGATLTPHFIVKYSKANYLCAQWLKKMKSFIIQLRGRLF